MFRLLVGLIILGLILVVVYVVGKIFYESVAKNSSKSNSASEIDEIIKDLETKIELAELRASKGVADAERDLEKYKSELEKAKKIKNKLS